MMQIVSNTENINWRGLFIDQNNSNVSATLMRILNMQLPEELQLVLLLPTLPENGDRGFFRDCCLDILISACRYYTINTKGLTIDDRKFRSIAPLKSSKIILIPGLLSHNLPNGVDIGYCYYLKLLFDVSGNLQVGDIDWGPTNPNPQVVEGSAYNDGVTLNYNFFSGDAQEYVQQQMEGFLQSKANIGYVFTKPKIKLKKDDFPKLNNYIMTHFVEICDENPSVEFLKNKDQDIISAVNRMIPTGDPKSEEESEVHKVMIHEDDINLALCLFALAYDGGITLG